MPLGLFTPPSGQGLVIPVFFYPAVRTGSTNTHFYPAVRTVSSNTHFFHYFPFFSWSLAPDYGFRSARQILAVFFATRARNCILSDLNMFYTPRGGRTTAGSNAPGAFLVFLPRRQDGV